MRQKESWRAIFATKEAHSTQRGQPPRMHGPGLWTYEQKEQKVTPVPMSGVNCNLWCPGWDSANKQTKFGALRPGRSRVRTPFKSPRRDLGQLAVVCIT